MENDGQDGMGGREARNLPMMMMLLQWAAAVATILAAATSSSMVLEFEAGAEWEKCSVPGGGDSMPIAWHNRRTNTSFLMSSEHSNMVAGTGPSLDQIVGRTKGSVFQSFCD
eukprot:SAG31_NODE_17370_length_673_cov_1.172474_1_plen_111_part_01